MIIKYNNYLITLLGKEKIYPTVYGIDLMVNFILKLSISNTYIIDIQIIRNFGNHYEKNNNLPYLSVVYNLFSNNHNINFTMFNKPKISYEYSFNNKNITSLKFKTMLHYSCLNCLYYISSSFELEKSDDLIKEIINIFSN